ncbi:MAG TPA: peptidylprolyl isomerase [Pyrinomonadaceae bacterium]|nr:peptidylprolyl isomerase [Pyrinomonadaceae bacterium]
MKRLFCTVFAILFVFSINNFAQIPTNILVSIVKAEDERRSDVTLENLLKNPNSKIRERAVLAIGRIGIDTSIPALEQLLVTEKDEKVRAMIMFAIGEIESVKGADMILKTLQDFRDNSEVTARAVEAAGKIAAANAKDEKSKELGKSIVERLEFENTKRSGPYDDVILLGLTAVLRARPDGGEKIVTEFLRYSNPRIRADALNTLARLRSKLVNEKSRELLAKDSDAVVRANAARMLGVGEDKTALELLLNAATKDADSRVRVSAIRALASLKDASVAEKLTLSPEEMRERETNIHSLCNRVDPWKKTHCFEFKNEYLEIATTLGRLLPNTNNEKAIKFLEKFRDLDKFESPESEIAMARIAPEKYVKEFSKPPTKEDLNTMKTNHRPPSSIAQGLGELANNPDAKIKAEAQQILAQLLNEIPIHVNAVSDVLTAYAAFKPNDLNQVLLKHLKHPDPIVRATAAGLLDNQPTSKENVEALKTAFSYALLRDKHDNDAQLAILDALFKLDKKEAVGSLLLALNAQDYLVRKKAFELLKTEGLEKDFPGLPTMLANAIAKKKNQVLPYSPVFGTKLGQVLNTNADYLRAVSRKNGTVKAVFSTTKGNFTIDLTPEDAPLTVDNFIKLAKSNYFNGISVHRVVPNFVMQDGDPRGDGNGGPGWSIRCEVNMLGYGRGAVGMALSGKDTGGSQWFVTHAPQPHLDGGYTIFGQVNETNMKVVDAIVRGDKILKVTIVSKK